MRLGALNPRVEEETVVDATVKREQEEKRAADTTPRSSRSRSSKSQSCSRSHRRRRHSSSLLYSPPRDDTPRHITSTPPASHDRTSQIPRDIRDGAEISIEQLNAMVIEWDREHAKREDDVKRAQDGDETHDDR